MTPALPSLSRRQLLAGSASLAFGAVVGCRPEPTASPLPERNDIPLRLLLVGEEQDAETIRRGWGAVTELPLAIDTIPLDRTKLATLSDRVLESLGKSDVAIYPLALVPMVSNAEAAIAMSDDDLDRMDQESGNLLAALRSGASQYAGKALAVPLGSLQPALLADSSALLSESDGGDASGNDAASFQLDSWEAYDRLVDQQFGGKAAEPTAPGWAGMMFLWRCTSAKNWLFHREDLHPVIDSDDYVASLELMCKTAGRYQEQDASPQQIWEGVKSGSLRGGIGFPQADTDGDGDLQIHNLPGVSQLSKLLLDPYSTVASLATSCRQSAAAKRFIRWISGGEGSESVRSNIAGMAAIRVSNLKRPKTDQSAAASYDDWLGTRLSSPLTLPTLQLLRAGDYYAALDTQVRRALAGETDPPQALADTAMQWQKITAEVGVDKQRRAWRRGQGIGSLD